jgi:chemotaxis protein methyltransferase CheR
MQQFDVIFCCNVLIYMTEDAIARVLATLRAMLADEGYLLLGYTESLQGARGEFEPVRVGDYVAYRRRRPAVAPVVRVQRVSTLGAGRAVPEAAVATVALHSPPVADAELPSLPDVDGSERAYARARAHFDADRQEAAMAELSRLLEANPSHCGARLLKGYIHGSQGAFLDGAAECTKVLDLDPYEAEAYLLRATLLHQVGDVDDALGEAKKALFLAPELAIGQYLLGKLHEQRGDRQSAARAFANAARTLRARPEAPLAMHLPVELGRDTLLHLVEQRLDAQPPPSSRKQEDGPQQG